VAEDTPPIVGHDRTEKPQVIWRGPFVAPYAAHVAYQVLESVAHPPLVLTPATTVYTGTIRIGPTSGFIVQIHGAAAEEFGHFPPDVPPLLAGHPEPAVWVETSIALGVIAGDGAFPLGVQHVRAGYVPDPRGGDARWLMVHGAAHAMGGLVLNYRITVQQR